MTTNCITEPRSTYADRIFTTGEVGWSGVRHIEGQLGQAKDYSPLIQRAQVRREQNRDELGGGGRSLTDPFLLPCAGGQASPWPSPEPVAGLVLQCSYQPTPATDVSCQLCPFLLQELPGFEWEPPEEQAKYVTTGFARNAVLGVAGEVVKAMQEGHLRHIFLIGGCDGSGERRGNIK
jgi:hydroxylamine reductase (hybrid-cluster protein)